MNSKEREQFYINLIQLIRFMDERVTSVFFIIYNSNDQMEFYGNGCPACFRENMLSAFEEENWKSAKHNEDIGKERIH